MEPMPGPSRREVLARLALGGAGLWFYRRPALTAGTTGLDELARQIRAAEATDIYQVGAGALRAGATPETLLAASFLAGVCDIRPHGVGGKFHAVLMVESAFQLLDASSPEERKLAALWALWDFKRCQERDVREEGDWKLPAVPEVSFTGEAAARRELHGAMKEWNVERAERAVIGLLPFHERASLFELLWPYGSRCYADLGHKIIYCVHAERTLTRIGWQHAQPVLRSLIRGLLYVDDAGPQTDHWEQAWALSAALPTTRKPGAEDPTKSLEILRELRNKTPGACRQLVVDAFREGVGPATVWDGLRLHAAEVFHRRAPAAERRHGPVHPVTELNAFAHVWRTAKDERLRLAAALQTAAWTAQLRDDLEGIFGEQRQATLDALGVEHDDTAPGLAAVFKQPSAGGARAAIDAAEDGANRYLGLLRRYLYERAFQDHQYKFVAALHEESVSIHPTLRSRLLAPAVTYVPAGRDPETEMSRRSRRALRG